MTEAVSSAMVLAAGRGERMRPLTDHTPKSLLKVGGHALIEHHLSKLARAGFGRVVINHAHLGEQIVSAVGDGSRWGITILFSAERQALETAGGIANALSLLDAQAFAVVNADIFSDYDYAKLNDAVLRLARNPENNAHLVLVDNPPHNKVGDFALKQGSIVTDSGAKLTFAGLGAYRASMFASLPAGAKTALAPILRAEIQAGHVSGEHFGGYWADVGTPERLDLVNKYLEGRSK